MSRLKKIAVDPWAAAGVGAFALMPVAMLLKNWAI